MKHSYTILHITDGFLSFKQNSSFPIGVGGKITAGFIKAGHQVIEFPYRQIAGGIFSSYRTSLGIRSLEQKLRALVLNISPDIIVFGQAYCFKNDFISELKELAPEAKFLGWHQDSIFENGFDSFIARSLIMDASFISTSPSVLKKEGIKEQNIYYLPIPVDTSVERAQVFLKKQTPYDIFCSVGNSADQRLICNKEEDLNNFVRFIKDGLPADTNYAFAGVGGKPAIYGKQYRDMLEASAIGLNLSRPGNIPFYSSDRIAQIIGNGMLLAIEEGSGFAHLLGGDKAVLSFASKDELLDKLAFFIKNPEARQKVAETGYRSYHNWFNSVAVANYLLDTIVGSKNADSLVWLNKIKEYQS